MEFLLIKRAQKLNVPHTKWAYHIWSVSHLISNIREVMRTCSVFLYVWVCGTFPVHHFISTELLCAPLTVVCTTDLRCAPRCTRGTYYMLTLSWLKQWKKMLDAFYQTQIHKA